MKFVKHFPEYEVSGAGTFCCGHPHIGSHLWTIPLEIRVEK